MNYNFFAAKTDKLQVLDFLFSEMHLQAFDSYSPCGEPVRHYESMAAICSTFDLESGGQFAISLALWTPNFLGAISYERINLNPKHCDGHTFRYRTDGWGLIYLHLGNEQHGRLYHSTINHFSQRGALINAQDSLSAVGWNWKEITRIGRQIKYFICQKIAADKIGSQGIMPGAAERQQQGIILR